MTKKETEQELALLQAQFDEFSYKLEYGVTVGHLTLISSVLDKLGDDICTVDYQHHHCEEKPSELEYQKKKNLEECVIHIEEQIEKLKKRIESVK
jgi:hypothetical protein